MTDDPFKKIMGHFDPAQIGADETVIYKASQVKNKKDGTIGTRIHLRKIKAKRPRKPKQQDWVDELKENHD